MNIPGLYAGMSLPLSAQGIYKSFIFTFQTSSSLYLSKTYPDLSPHTITVTTGVLAGSLNALLFVTPVEYYRTNKIINPSLKLSMLSNMSQIYKGSVVTVTRDGLGCGAFFIGLEMSKSFCKQYAGDHDMNGNVSLTTSFISGAVAGISFWLIALPFDTLRTLTQSSQSSFYYITRIKRKPWMLYRGLRIAAARAVPGAGVTVVTFEWTKERCRRLGWVV
jgi:hypothetical protein